MPATGRRTGIALRRRRLLQGGPPSRLRPGLRPRSPLRRRESDPSATLRAGPGDGAGVALAVLAVTQRARPDAAPGTCQCVAPETGPRGGGVGAGRDRAHRWPGRPGDFGEPFGFAQDRPSRAAGGGCGRRCRRNPTLDTVVQTLFELSDRRD